MMTLQQLRYVVATADEGTMTRAAAQLQVAQPALSRGVRALESEIGVSVFVREGRGLRVTDEGREVVALARRVLGDVQRIANLHDVTTLQVCVTTGLARELGAPAVARFVTDEGERVALDVVDASGGVVAAVRRGRAEIGVLELPAPAALQVVPLGWQEIVLIHPASWDLPDPLDVAELARLPLLSPERGDWRHEMMLGTLRSLGVEPTIAAETNDRATLVSLVQQGAGAWFAYGRQARTAADGGARMVHLAPRPVREVAAVHAGELRPLALAFLDALRVEAADTLIPAGDSRLEGATWVGAEAMGSVPPASLLPASVPPASPP